MLRAVGIVLEGVARRAATLASADEVNAYFASDAMISKLREIVAELGSLDEHALHVLDGLAGFVQLIELHARQS